MSESKILLYYCFTPLADPTAVMLWQRTVCQSLGLRGRILISSAGINGTVGGEIDACRTYVRRTREYPGLKDMEFKWSAGGAEDFPRLSVKVRPEIVSFGAPGELQVDEHGVVGGGTHLSPEGLHELVAEREDVVFFDGRNAFEAQIGAFRDAIVPDVRTTGDFVAELDSGKYDALKSKPVVTYCTGGIRCEVLTSLMRARGFNEVYQLDGGIVRYGERFGNTGLWEGSLYVFDRRMHMEFGPAGDPAYVQRGFCEDCGAPTNSFANCDNEDCRTLRLVCSDCRDARGRARCTHGG